MYLAYLLFNLKSFVEIDTHPNDANRVAPWWLSIINPSFRFVGFKGIQFNNTADSFVLSNSLYCLFLNFLEIGIGCNFLYIFIIILFIIKNKGSSYCIQCLLPTITFNTKLERAKLLTVKIILIKRRAWQLSSPFLSFQPKYVHCWTIKSPPKPLSHHHDVFCATCIQWILATYTRTSVDFVGDLQTLLPLLHRLYVLQIMSLVQCDLLLLFFKSSSSCSCKIYNTMKMSVIVN